MNYKRMNVTTFLATVFSVAIFGMAMLTAVTDANAQRRFDPKATGTENELRNVGQITQDLLNFIKQAEVAEQNPSPAEHKKLQDLGRRIKDGTSNFRGSLQGFTSKIKRANRWNADFDTEFADSISNPKIRAFIQTLGGARKALTDAEAAIGSLGQDVDATVNDAKMGINLGDNGFFKKASFASGSAGKVRLKCVLLGVGVAAAEIARLKLTAGNLDNLFDNNKCGGGSPTVS